MLVVNSISIWDWSRLRPAHSLTQGPNKCEHAPHSPNQRKVLRLQNLSDTSTLLLPPVNPETLRTGTKHPRPTFTQEPTVRGANKQGHQQSGASTKHQRICFCLQFLFLPGVAIPEPRHPGTNSCRKAENTTDESKASQLTECVVQTVRRPLARVNTNQARDKYSPLRVSILSVSPCLIYSGT